jgi:hypothetical protein
VSVRLVFVDECGERASAFGKFADEPKFGKLDHVADEPRNHPAHRRPRLPARNSYDVCIYCAGKTSVGIRGDVRDVGCGPCDHGSEDGEAEDHHCEDAVSCQVLVRVVAGVGLCEPRPRNHAQWNHQQQAQKRLASPHTIDVPVSACEKYEAVYLSRGIQLGLGKAQGQKELRERDP